jgi:hypothetical protein
MANKSKTPKPASRLQGVSNYNPEEIMLAKRLSDVLNSENAADYIRQFGAEFSKASKANGGPPQTFANLFRYYIEGTHLKRQVINELTVSFCGADIETLLDRIQAPKA